MPIINLKCTSCGANMEAEDGTHTYFCPYCGSKIENAAERVEITFDHSNEPNLVVNYNSIHPGVMLVVRIVSTGQKSIYMNGQRATYHLQPGMQRIILKIGKKNYARDVFINPKKGPVTINCAYTGRGQITVDQPPYTAEEAAPYMTPETMSNAGARMSPMAIVAFVLSFLGYIAPVGVVLGVIDLIKKDKTKKHGLAVAAIAVGAVMTIAMLSTL